MLMRMDEEEKERLINLKEYQEAGVQIGARIRTPKMSRFITKRWKEDLYLLDLDATEERIKTLRGCLPRTTRKT